MKNGKFAAGDWVIFRKSKQSPVPGPRAQQVTPSRHGDLYSYIVPKFWVVVEVMPGDQLRLRTRRGKEHVISVDDPNLHQPRFWERWLYRKRFEEVARSLTESSSQSN